MTEPAPQPAVLSVGRLYCDLIFTDLPRLPELGTEVFTDGFGAHPGGGAYITAAHLSALGHSSTLATMLPSSPFSDLMRHEIAASKVDLTLSGTLPEAAGPQITVAMVKDGDRAFLTRRAGPAFPRLDAAEIEARDIRHIHIGEITSLAAQPEIVPLARSLGLSLSADCGWDDGLGVDVLRPLVGLVDIFLPNEAEWGLLGRMGLADGFAPLTVIKRGASGATAIQDGESISAAATPLRAVDTTGAGDAFNAGFLSCWLAGASLADCLDAGNARGALSVQSRGGYAAADPMQMDPGLIGQ